jgi:hypothetical protein
MTSCFGEGTYQWLTRSRQSLYMELQIVNHLVVLGVIVQAASATQTLNLWSHLAEAEPPMETVKMYLQ